MGTKMYKLVVLDLDGTLLTTDKKITDRTKKVIWHLAAQGVIIALASGRTMSGIRGVIDELSLKSESLYVIACNGAQVWSESTQHFIANQCLSVDDVRFIRQWGRLIGMACYTQHAGELVVEDNRDIPLNARRYSRLGIHVTTDTLLLNMPAPKVMFIEDQFSIDLLAQQVPADIIKRYQCVRSEPHYYEVMAMGVNKGEACRILAAYLGIASVNILALGNELNDCEMLRYAGKGIAMGNASEVVQRCADDITASNDEEGVAKAITRFCLN
ncbi:hypothetical protein CYR34_14360 [Chimaeribacter arupi]|uniref:Cof-type HAD-IIB family hydrolase n=2 Tax=Chimaeribacter arupi TaxID=2060066 RepID=A0A2N5EKS0_9GAMM|nr:hypothetical protein CYR34_14360 [Chimaeribacter arupi]